MPDKEQISIPEAIGFWKKNKGWILPAIAALGGLLGGNVDRIPIPELPIETVTSRLDNHEARINVLEGKPAGTKTTDSKKNDEDDVIRVE